MFGKITIIIALCTLFACDGSTSSVKVESNELHITIDSVQQRFDTIKLGRIIEGEQVSGSFIVENDKTEPLIIANIITGCGCTTTKFDGKPILPAQEARVDFMFDSKGRQGTQLKIIDVISTDHFTTRIVLEAFVKENN